MIIFYKVSQTRKILLDNFVYTWYNRRISNVVA